MYHQKLRPIIVTSIVLVIAFSTLFIISPSLFAHAQAGTLTVTTLNDVNDPNATQTCANNGVGPCSLRDALGIPNPVGAYNSISLAGLTGKLQLDQGVLTINHSVNITGPKPISSCDDPSGLTISGKNDIQGNTPSQIFSIIPATGTTPTINISQVALCHGTAGSQWGGAIYNNLSILNITDATIGSNISVEGGGIYNENGVVHITRTYILQNIANGDFLRYGNGGGIANPSGFVTIDHSYIDSNISDFPAGTQWVIGGGGGIWNEGSLYIDTTTITGNNAQAGGAFLSSLHTGYGGGIDGTGLVTITNSTIVNNKANFAGGGLDNEGTQGVSISNSTFQNNIAYIEGGGGIIGGVINATNDTITQNRSLGFNQGGNLLVTNPSTLQNSIVSSSLQGGNCTVDLIGYLQDNGNNLQYPDTGCGSTIRLGNPNLNSLAYYPAYGTTTSTIQTMSLAQDSAAINGGNNCPLTDERGVTRAGKGFACDIGAYENDNPAEYGPRMVYSLTDTSTPDDFTCVVTTCTLRQAINTAPSGDTIIFANNLAGTLQLASPKGSLSIARNLTINGPGANLIAVDGNNQTRVFLIRSVFIGQKTTISGLTVQNGLDGAQGGGIDNGTGDLLLSYMVIQNNTVNCTLTGPSDCPGGGGIYNIGSSLTLANTSVTGNKVTHSDPLCNCSSVGGGISSYGGVVNINSSTVAGNTVSDYWAEGGGIYSATPLNVINSTISGNAVNGFNITGGGIYTDSTTSIKNSTIASNQAIGLGSYGGGILSGPITFPITLANTIIANNTATGGNPDLYVQNNLTSLGYNLIGINSGVTGLVSTDKSGVNPLLYSLELNPPGTTMTQALQSNSPAINYAKANCPPVDQRGVARNISICDSGAYQTSNTVFPTTAPTLIAPTGAITMAAPTFTWNAVNGGWGYYIYVANGSGTVMFTQWVGNPCSGATCSFNSPMSLTGNSYIWWVAAYGNNIWSPYSNPLSFALPPTLIGPSGNIANIAPIFTWNAIFNAWGYYVYAKTGSTVMFAQWVDSGSACTSTTCTFASPVNLPYGSYTWSAAAYSADWGWTAYATPLAFTDSAGAVVPTTPTLVPSATLKPTFQPPVKPATKTQ